MKKIFIPTLLGIVLCMNACKTSKPPAVTANKEPESNIILANGQKITVVTSSTGETDLSMGMTMKNNSSATNVIIVVSSDDKSYSISNALTKSSMSVSMMGQETTYDSEKPADKDNEIGKLISPKLNKPDTSLVNRFTGYIMKHSKNPEEKDNAENPLGNMMQGLSSGDKNAVLDGAFFILSKDKKVGDSWTDSSAEEKMKTVKTYTIKSIENNIAIIDVKGVLTGNGETEMQGTAVAFTMESKSTGEMIVDLKKSLVNKSSVQSDIIISMEVMGQTLPVTSKVNSTITYQY